MEDLQGSVLALQHRYEVLHLGSVSPTTRVYRAKLEPFSVEVELQVFDGLERLDVPKPVAEAIVARVEAQARAASRQRSPHSVRVLDYGQLQPHIPFVITDVASRSSLDKVIEAQGALPLEGTIRVVEQIGEALEELHRLGVGHLSVRPECVFFVDRGREEPVTQLGGAALGLLQHEIMTAGDRVAVSRFVLDHLAPEVVGSSEVRAWREALQTRIDVDEDGEDAGWGDVQSLPPSPSPGDFVAADVFGLAVLTYRCLTGRSPFWDEPPAGARERFALLDACEPIHPREREVRVSSAVWKVLRSGMARDPGARHPSVEDFVNALRRAAPSIRAETLKELQEEEWMDLGASFGEDVAAPEEAPEARVASVGGWFSGSQGEMVKYLVAAVLLLVVTNLVTLLLLVGTEPEKEEVVPSSEGSWRLSP